MSDSNDKKVHTIDEKALSLAKFDSTLAPPFMTELA